MNNRISIALDPQDVADFQAAQATQKRLLEKWLLGINLEQIPAGTYMGDGEGWSYCKDGFQFATECPKSYDDELFDMAEFTKDYRAAEFLVGAKKANEEVVKFTTVASNLVGMDLMEGTNYLKECADKKRNVNTTYMSWWNKLKAYAENKAAKAVDTRNTNQALTKANEELAQVKAQMAEMTKAQ